MVEQQAKAEKEATRLASIKLSFSPAQETPMLDAPLWSDSFFLLKIGDPLLDGFKGKRKGRHQIRGGWEWVCLTPWAETGSKDLPSFTRDEAAGCSWWCCGGERGRRLGYKTEVGLRPTLIPPDSVCRGESRRIEANR